MRTLSETPDLRWFEDTYKQKCHGCGKRADGLLRGKRNESYGPHCQRCADRHQGNHQQHFQQGHAGSGAWPPPVAQGSVCHHSKWMSAS